MKRSPEEIEKALEQMRKQDNLFNSLTAHFKNIYGGFIERNHIFDALFLLLADKHDMEWPGDLWDVEIDFDEAKQLLASFDFDILRNTIETERNIFPEGTLIEYKVRIKSSGLIWIIHRYDVDPFPSNPHAHQIDNNIKMDLSNGKCYKKRKLIHQLPKKEFLKIRELAMAQYKGTLPELALAN